MQNDIPDLQKYLDYYKWLDTAMGQMIEQLFPVSARYAPSVRNVIESHTLERNKVQHKYPMIKDPRAWKYTGVIGNLGGDPTPLGVEGDPHHPSTFGAVAPTDHNTGRQVGTNDLGGGQIQDGRGNYGDDNDTDGAQFGELAGPQVRPGGEHAGPRYGGGGP